MKILVVTPTRGDSPWLEECVASVARIDGEPRHVLVALPDQVASLQVQFPGALVLAEPPGARGMYAAINAGIRAAGDYDAFTYLNDDDVLLPGFEHAVGTLAASEGGPLIAYGRVRLIDARGRRLGAIPVSPAPTLNRALYAQRIEPVFQHGTLISRAAMERLRGFDETLRYCADTEFLARACVNRIPFVRVGGAPVAAFRLRRGQLTKNRPAMLAERARVDEKLRLLAPRRTWQHVAARWRFRTANLLVYAERFARFGWISFDQLLERAG